jgi:UDP-N-acetylglucosamine 2-epimerase (non-hydrolysing)
LTYSTIARDYLIKEGLPADRIIKIGSPIYEVLMQFFPQIESSQILEKLNLKKDKYFVVSAHREENINSEKNFSDLIFALNRIVEKYNYPVIFSCHPRTRNMIKSKNVHFNENIKLMKPMALGDYIRLQMDSYVVLSDSGTISEESSILNFRALNIREAHERPEAMEEASVMMVGLNPDRIFQGLEEVQNQNLTNRNFRPVYDYSMPNVSDKVVRIIISYTDYIKRVVWNR